MKFDIEFIVYVLLLLLIVAGAFLINEGFLGGSKYIAKYKFSLRRSTKRIVNIFRDSTVDEIFMNAGIRLSMKKYTTIRSFGILLLICMMIICVTNEDYIQSVRLGIFLLITYLVTYPKNSIKGKKTPFKLILDVMYKNRQDRKDTELFSAISQMKNVILAHNSSAVSSDYLFSKLLRFTDVSKPIFLKTQNLIITGRKEEAGKYFAEAYGTKFGKDFSRIIPKLDELHPKEFLDQLILFQNNMRELYQTKKEKEQSRNMMIMTALSTMELTIFMINFMYLIFVDTLQYMKF